MKTIINCTKRVTVMLLFACLATTVAQATEYIKDVILIGGTKAETDALKESLGQQGWNLIDKDLNKGAGGDFIYLLYKSEEKTYNKGYITDLYIRTGNNPPGSLIHNEHTYNLVLCQGGESFVNSKGDLNRGSLGDYITLYYTRDFFTDNRTVTDITFNGTKSGGLGANGGSEGYDLNNNTRIHREEIYLHFTTATASRPDPDPSDGKYNLWLGKTQVTVDNRDNILGQTDANGNPRAMYDGTTKTLTLNNPTIDGYVDDKYCKIYSSGINLTIEGNYNFSASDTYYYDYGLLAENGSLALVGDFLFNMPNTETAVKASNLTLRSGTLTVVGGYCGIECNTLSIENGFTKLDAQSCYNAVSVNNGIFIGGDLVIMQPIGGENRGDRIVDTNGDEANHVVIANPGVAYNLWLGGVRVTDANKDNILGQTDANSNPTAQYNPDTHVLTLNNPTIDGMFSSRYCKIYSSGIDLTIEGNYSFSDSDAYFVNGLLIENGSLALAGDFLFNMPNTETAIKAGNLTLRSGTLTVVGWIYGIECNTLTLESGFTKLDVQGRQFAIGAARNGISIGEDFVVEEPAGGCANERWIIDKNGDETQHAVITNAAKTSVLYPLWIGNTQVSSFNKDNILNQEGIQYLHMSSASYDPKNNVLTLSEPSISGSHNNAKICSFINGLSINGDYHMTEADANDADYGFLEVTFDACDTKLDGDFVFYGKKTGIRADGEVTVKVKGSLKAVGASEYGLEAYYLMLDDAPAHVELVGGNKAMGTDYANYSSSVDYSLHLPEHGVVNERGILCESDGTISKHVDIDVLVHSTHIYLHNQNPSNSQLVNTGNGITIPASDLAGRTLYRDGKWNTICLPFEQRISGGVLDGAEVRKLNSASFENGILTLNFSDPISYLMPGTPYIIRWTPAREYNLYNPLFLNVTFDNTNNDFVSADGKVSFLGTYDYISFDAEDRTILFMGEDNKLYYPQDGATIGSCRAYFQLNGITAADPGNPVKAFRLNFGDDDEADAVEIIPCSTFNSQSDDAIYDLSGRRINSQLSIRNSQLPKGVYIRNGKKFAVK